MCTAHPLHTFKVFALDATPNKMTQFTLLGGVSDGGFDPSRHIKAFRSRDDGIHVIDYWLQAQGKGSKGKF